MLVWKVQHRELAMVLSRSLVIHASRLKGGHMPPQIRLLATDGYLRHPTTPVEVHTVESTSVANRNSLVGLVLPLGCESEVGPPIIKGVVILVIHELTSSGAQQEAVEIDLTVRFGMARIVIWIPSVGVACALCRMPCPPRYGREISIINQCVKSFGQLNPSCPDDRGRLWNDDAHHDLVDHARLTVN